VAFGATPIERFVDDYRDLTSKDTMPVRRLECLRERRAKEVFHIVFASDPSPSDRANVIERELYAFGSPRISGPVLLIPSYALV